MSRYIDADLIQYNEYIPDLDVWAASKTQIDNIPTADVRENVRGEWEHGDETARHYLGDACVQIDYAYWRCSACGKVYEQSDKPKYNFCHNCGADMRGEES